MALDEISEFYEPLSAWKKWTSVILGKLRQELSGKALAFYDVWASQFAREVDICVALWRWEEKVIEGTTIILANVSWEVDNLLQDFTLKRRGHVIEMKQERQRSTRKNGL
jgi:hypothetical protein